MMWGYCRKCSSKSTRIYHFFSVRKSSYARRVEARQSRPVANLSGVATDTDEHAMRWCRAIKNEQLMPPWRRDIRVWWCSDGARVAIASEGGEDSAASHGVAVSARHRRNERDAHCLTLERLYVDLVSPAVGPVGIRHGHDRLLEARAQVWGNVDLDTKLFR